MAESTKVELLNVKDQVHLTEELNLGIPIHVHLKLGSTKRVDTEKALQTQMPARITQIK